MNTSINKEWLACIWNHVLLGSYLPSPYIKFNSIALDLGFPNLILEWIYYSLVNGTRGMYNIGFHIINSIIYYIIFFSHRKSYTLNYWKYMYKWTRNKFQQLTAQEKVQNRQKYPPKDKGREGTWPSTKKEHLRPKLREDQ